MTQDDKGSGEPAKTVELRKIMKFRTRRYKRITVIDDTTNRTVDFKIVLQSSCGKLTCPAQRLQR
jgi:hypothetical protein